MEGDGMSIIKNVNMVLKYIDEHLEETLMVKKLAKVAGYSEYHFIRVFKECMNITIMEYVCKRRLMKASEDILLGEKIIDVAMKYGWKSHSGFTKAFKKEFGFSPSLLRAMKFSVENLGGSAMSHEFLGTTKVGATKEELFAILQNKMKLNGVYVERNRLIKIYRTACSAYGNVKRYSGEEYVTHLLNVSIVLAEIGATANVILAGMFCDVSKKGVVSLADLSIDLPKEIHDIIVKVQDTSPDLTIATDDVILIKLAERLHNMRTIEFIDESKKQQKAKETIELFIPLARKLGNKKLIDELNDLSMKYYN